MTDLGTDRWRRPADRAPEVADTPACAAEVEALLSPQSAAAATRRLVAGAARGRPAGAASSPPALALGGRPAVGAGAPHGGAAVAGPVISVGPPRSHLSQRRPGGWAVVREEWPTDRQQAEVVARYLNAVEMGVYDRLNRRARRTWLLGRVAVKDAARFWLADRGHVVAPTALTVANDADGRPFLVETHPAHPGWWRQAALPDLRISIAHLPGVGAAAVRQGDAVGIDVEELRDRPRSFLRVAFAEAEHRDRAAGRIELHRRLDEPTWVTAAWCVKEAAAKAAGTGLQGRPMRFVTSLVDHDLFAVGDRRVRWTLLDPHRFRSAAGHPVVVAWTVGDGSPSGRREPVGPRTPALAGGEGR